MRELIAECGRVRRLREGAIGGHAEGLAFDPEKAGAEHGAGSVAGEPVEGNAGGIGGGEGGRVHGVYLLFQ
jgi:hypothetical protein